MDIVNEKIGIKEILSGLADLVFIKDTFSKKEKKEKDNKKEFEEKLNEVYKAQEEIGATKRIESYEQDIEKHEEPKTRQEIKDCQEDSKLRTSYISRLLFLPTGSL